MSKQYEHDVANTIDRVTGDEVRAFRIGFSGSSAKPNPDVLVNTPRDDYALEIKDISRDRCTVRRDDVEQLVECRNSHTSVWLVINFNNRETITVRYYDAMTGDGFDEDSHPTEKFAALFPEACNAHVTDECGNLIIEKPPSDEWTSKRRGEDDAIAILRDLGLKNPSSTAV